MKAHAAATKASASRRARPAARDGAQEDEGLGGEGENSAVLGVQGGYGRAGVDGDPRAMATPEHGDERQVAERDQERDEGVRPCLPRVPDVQGREREGKGGEGPSARPGEARAE